MSFDRDLLILYADGQCSPEEASRAEQLLAETPGARAEFARLLRQRLMLAELAAGKLAQPVVVLGDGERPETAVEGGGPHPIPLPAGEGEMVRGRLGWVVAASAAAVVVIVSGLFAFDLLPSGNVTLFNNQTSALEKRLSDGTVLTAAPGAKLKATGRDRARSVRQVIRLESGEVTVVAPKAGRGEAACRVETVEGLWVETVGTVFTVTKTYEDSKGARDVDKSKLTGAMITAVLLVTVAEGEVRTGRAAAEEARVAAGGEVVVREVDRPKDEALAKVEKALAKEVTLELVEQPLEECLKYLEGLAEISFAVHPDKGFDPRMPVSLRLSKVPLSTALDWMLQLGGMKREYRNEALHLLPRGKDEPGPALVKDGAFEKLFAEKAAKKLNFEFVQAPVAEAINFIQSVSGLNTVMDPACTVVDRQKITLRGNQMSLGAALDNILELADFRRQFGKGALYISPKNPPSPEELKAAAERRAKAEEEMRRMQLMDEKRRRSELDARIRALSEELESARKAGRIERATELEAMIKKLRPEGLRPGGGEVKGRPETGTAPAPPPQPAPKPPDVF